MSLSLLDQIDQLCDEGKLLSAYEASRPLGPLKTWRGVKARAVATRLAWPLGASKLHNALTIRLYREHPGSLTACTWYARRLAGERGPLRALSFMESCGAEPGATAEELAEWSALRARLLATLRDFDSSRRAMDEAFKRCPGQRFLRVEEARILVKRDQRREALALIDDVLAESPWYSPAVNEKSELLLELGRDEEAVAFLREAIRNMQAGYVIWELAALLGELKQYEESRRLYESCADFFPLIEKKTRMWLDARRSDAAYREGDFTTAAELAKTVDWPFYKKLVENFAAANGESRRVVLDIPFIRQHHITCGPTTLASIAAYWKFPVDHLEVAEKICYDGTSSLSERRWAVEQGFIAREFTMDWDSTVALIDRGVPFSLETRGALSAHLQGVAGYDSRRGVVVIREPSERHLNEFLAAACFEKWASVGPRAMAIVPAAEAARLEGIKLPDSELYDDLYALNERLEKHDRAGAAAALDRMREAAPNHRLTLAAAATLAHYDGDDANALKWIEKQLELYPDDSILEYRRLRALSTLGRRAERRERLIARCEGSLAAPIFFRELANDLEEDSRFRAAARDWANRAHRAMPLDAETFSIMANIEWSDGRREIATNYYRFAACLEDKIESYSRSYFVATRHFHRVEESIAWLRNRFAEYGHKSPWPAITLARALEDLDRQVEALQVIEAALARRPEDGELLSNAVSRNLAVGRFDRAAEMLALAEGRTHRATWLRYAADLAESRGELLQALAHRRELAQIEPLDAGNHDAVFDLIVTTASEDEAIAYFAKVAADQPHHLHTQTAYLSRIRERDLVAATDVARAALALHPNDGWTRRELAILLQKRGLNDEALEEFNKAAESDANHPSSFQCRGHWFADMGRREEARADYRRALTLDPDSTVAMKGLDSACDGAEQRREALDFVQNLLRRQTTFGNGLLFFFDLAEDVYRPDELLAILQESLAARPDLWHAHAVHARQLARMDRLDEAQAAAAEATRRFPLLPGAWRDLAQIEERRGDRPAQIAALEKAVAINPAWRSGATDLAEAYEAAGDPTAARRTLDNLLARTPRDAVAHGYLGDFLWRQNERAAALEHLKTACVLDPGYSWAWNSLRNWLAEEDRASEEVSVAADAVRQRPYDCDAWFESANAARKQGNIDEALAALDRATTLAPRYIEAHATRAEILSDAKRWDEALAATTPAAWPDKPPPRLLAEKAHILALSGEIDAGIETFKEVVAESPKYTWAIQRLCDLTWEKDRYDECADAARRWTEADPAESRGWGYLGGICVSRKEHAQAIPHFEKALELEADYSFASTHLARCYLAEGEFEKADDLTKSAREEGSDGELLEIGVEIDLARNGPKAELADLKRLAALPENSYWWDRLGDAMKDNPHSKIVSPVLASLLADPASPTSLGRIWAALNGDSPRASATLADVMVPTAAWRSAVLVRLDSLRKSRKITPFIKTAWPALERDRDDYLWAMVGKYLLDRNANKLATKWLANWRTRAEIQPWMLFNTMLAFWRTEQFSEAREVCRAAIPLAQNQSVNELKTRLAVLDFLFGEDVNAVAESLPDVVPDDCGKYEQMLFQLLRPLLDNLLAIRGKDISAYRQSLTKFRSAIAENTGSFESYSIVRRLVFTGLARIAEQSGRRLESAWYRFRAYFATGWPKRFT